MAAFPQTRWTLIRQAAESDHPDARRALEDLCEQYSGPVLAFLRHRVSSPEKAEDIAQSFFAKLLERDLFARADPDRGRFRTFFLHALKGFVADVHGFDTAQKRGGKGDHTISLEVDGVAEPHHEQSPDHLFDLEWVDAILRAAVVRLRKDYEDTGKGDLFAKLRVFLDMQEEPVVSDVARELRMTEPAVRVAVHRMRKRLGDAIRAEIAETVDEPSEVDDELNWLMQVLETRS
ncbi:MAG: RNA polymerase sigma factor [Planctomycetaceae bacterium]